MKGNLSLLRNSIVLFALCIIHTFTGCKKTEIFSSDPEPSSAHGFFDLPQNAPSAVRKVAAEFERQNKMTGFVKGLVASEGMPVWKKAIIQIQDHPSVTGFGGGGELNSDTVVIVPFVITDSNMVTSFSVSRIGDTTSLNFYRDNDYNRYPYGRINSDTTTADKIALQLVILNDLVFGHHKYEVKDTLLFKKFYPDVADTFKRTIELNLRGGSHGSGISNLVTVYEGTYCQMGTGSSFAGGGSSTGGFLYWICYDFTFEINDFDWMPDDGPIPTGGGGGGGGGSYPQPGEGPTDNCTGTSNCGGRSAVINGILPCGNCGPGPIVIIPLFDAVQGSQYLKTLLSLSNAKTQYLLANPDICEGLIDQLNSEGNDDPSIRAAKITVDALYANVLEGDYDEDHYDLIKVHFPAPYDAASMDPSFWLYFSLECVALKIQHPTWSKWMIYYHAMKDVIHGGLDLAGLIPVVGEVADLANGIIYTIEGDGVNATLSFAAMVPIAGWAATGVKYAIKTDGLKFIVVGANNLVTFGAYNSKKFRKACGIVAGDATKQAHHILPRGSIIIEHPVIQKATQAVTNQGFHIDDALNGIAVATWRNQPNHHAYSNLIFNKLQAFILANPNATADQCYTFVTNLIQQAKTAIVNNPNVHLNNITF